MKKKDKNIVNEGIKEKNVVEAKINPNENFNPVIRTGTVRGVFNDYVIETDFDKDFEKELVKSVKETNLDGYNIGFFKNEIITNKERKIEIAEKKRNINKADYEEKIMIEEAEKEILRIELEENKEELCRLTEAKENYIKSYPERSKDLNPSPLKKIPWYAVTGVLIVLTCLAIASDSISIYDVLSRAILSNKFLIVGLCVAVVTLMDFSPMPLSDSILKITSKNPKERIQAILKTVFIILAIVILYSAVIELRLSHIDDYNDTLGVSFLKDTAPDNEVEISDFDSKVPDDKAKAMVWLLNVQPIASTIVLLVLALIHDRLKEENNRNKNLIDKKMALDAEGEAIDAGITRVSENIKRIIFELKVAEDHIDYFDLNEKLYKNALEEIERVAAFQQARYLMELSKKLNNPDDISNVSKVENLVFA